MIPINLKGYWNTKWRFIRASLCERPLVISRPYVCASLLVWSISAQFGYFMHRVPMGKGCVVTLNHVSESKVKVMAELYIKSLSGACLLKYGSYFTHKKSMVKGCAVIFNEVCWSRSYQTIEKSFVQSIYTFHLPLIGWYFT